MSLDHMMPDAPVFEVLIIPHRSMNRRGIAYLGIAVATMILAAALRFLLLGAWPVMIFCLLEAPLLGVLLAINLRRARASELIMIDQRHITVTRTDPGGRRKSFSVPTAWLQVNLEAGRCASRVILSSHGQGHEIGGFLNELDKVSLAGSLQRAVRDVRHPSFENPQLQDC